MNKSIPYLLPRELRLLARKPNTPVFIIEYHTEQSSGPYLVRENKHGLHLLPISVSAAWALVPSKLYRFIKAEQRTLDALIKYANVFLYGRPEQADAIGLALSKSLQDKQMLPKRAVGLYNNLRCPSPTN